MNNKALSDAQSAYADYLKSA